MSSPIIKIFLPAAIAGLVFFILAYGPFVVYYGLFLGAVTVELFLLEMIWRIVVGKSVEYSTGKAWVATILGGIMGVALTLHLVPVFIRTADATKYIPSYFVSALIALVAIFVLKDLPQEKKPFWITLLLSILGTVIFAGLGVLNF